LAACSRVCAQRWVPAARAACGVPLVARACSGGCRPLAAPLRRAARRRHRSAMFGFAVALPLVVVAWLVSGLLAYWLGTVAGRPLVLRLAGEPRVAVAERVIERGGAPRVPLWRYA
jgi:hypothetical protein